MQNKTFWAAMIAVLSPGSVEAAPCAARITHTPVAIGTAVAFSTGKLEVDADGAPNSYLIDGKGLSRTCDGVVGIVNGKKVEPGQANWTSICEDHWQKARASGDYSGVSIFGFMTDSKGVPIVQGGNDPLPDQAFVSTTSLSVPGPPETSQRHWVDAAAIPYIVLTRAFAKAHNVALGDVAAVYLPKTGKMAFATFADTGPALGEASVKLHMDIGHDPISHHSGIARANIGLDQTSVTLVFPGQHTDAQADAAAWTAAIDDVAGKAFKAWGGLKRLKACLS